MFCYSILSAGNFLSIQRYTRLYVPYRLVLFCLVALFLSILMSTRSFAAKGRHIAVFNQAPTLTGNNYLLVKCDSKKYAIFYHGYSKRSMKVWKKKNRCSQVFIAPMVNGKQLKKYAHTYNPAAFCVNPTLYTGYTVDMKPKPYTVHVTCSNVVLPING